MNIESLNIIPTDNFLISYIDPITKLRIRKEFECFKDAINYQEYVTGLYIYKNQDCLDQGSSIIELIGFYYQTHPKSTLLSKRGFIRDFVTIFGYFKLIEIKVTTIKGWMTRLQQEHNYSYKQMINLKNSLNLFFKFLIDINLIDSSPLTDIQFEKINQKPKPRFYQTTLELNHILSLAKNSSPGYHYPIFLLFIETACKSSELISLKWEQLNLTSKKIYFYKNTNIQERELPLSNELCLLLEKKQMTKNKNKLVFNNIEGKQFKRATLSRLLNDFKRKNNISNNWTFNDFRHSYVKNNLKNETTLNDLKYILGHDSIYTTRQIYSDILANFEGVPDSM